jgi:hypothetical protein
MNINHAFPTKYLSAPDLGTSEPVVTVDRVEMEPVGFDKEMKPVIYFQNKQKGIVLNRVNSRMLASIAGSDNTEDWTGLQVKLYVADVTFQGRMVEAIRIKSPVAMRVGRTAPAVADTAPAIAPSTDDIPF